MQTVKFNYSGPNTRRLTVSGRDQVIISGDNNSTQFFFTFQKSYANVTKFIQWGDFYVEDEYGTPIAPIYLLNDDDSFIVPSEVTASNSGKEIFFQIVFVNGTDYDDSSIIEMSLPFAVYVSNSVRDKVRLSQEDIIYQLATKGFTRAEFAINEETSLPEIRFYPLKGDYYALDLEVPYLDNEGKIDPRFLPPGTETQIYYPTTLQDMVENFSFANKCDFAILTDGTGQTPLDYTGNIFLKTTQEDEYNGWTLIYSQYMEENSIKVIKVNGSPLPIIEQTVELTVDQVPTRDSENPIESGQVYDLKTRVDDHVQNSSIHVTPLTPNKAIISNASGRIEATAVDASKINYLQNVTSDIQEQLDLKTSVFKSIGDWDQTRQYQLGSTVIYDMKLYISLNGEGNINKTPDQESAYWKNISGYVGQAFAQLTPSTNWVFTHSLGRRAIVQIVDTAGNIIEGSVNQVQLPNDEGYRITVNFNTQMSGIVLLI